MISPTIRVSLGPGRCFIPRSVPLAETAENKDPARGPASRPAEILTFLVLAVLIWPIVAVGVVGGYGFLVWMSQIVLGPPGPPS